MGLSPFCGFAYDVCFAYRGVVWCGMDQGGGMFLGTWPGSLFSKRRVKPQECSGRCFAALDSFTRRSSLRRKLSSAFCGSSSSLNYCLCMSACVCMNRKQWKMLSILTLEIFSSLFSLLLSNFSVCFAPSCTLSILGQFIIRNWSCIFTGLWKTKYTPWLTSF